MITMVKATITKALWYNKLAKSLLQSKWCYKCKGSNHQAKDCSYGWPQELLINQDDNVPPSAYQTLPYHPVPTILLEKQGRTVYSPARYVNLMDTPVFRKHGNSSPPAGNIFKWARSQSPTWRGMRYPEPNEGQLLHRYGRPAPEILEPPMHKWACMMSPTWTIHDKINNDTMDPETEEDLAMELVRYAHLNTFNQEQIQEALQGLLEDVPREVNWQLAHMARLRRAITDNQVYMSAWKSMTVRFYTHSTKKRAKGTALVDSGVTENFLNLGYA